MATIATEFQVLAGAQGAEYEAHCRSRLEQEGWSLTPRLPRYRTALGVEIDIVADNENGARVYFECKGSWRPPRPGLMRTDTVKKAITNAYLANPDGLPFIVLTTHLPEKGSLGYRMLHYAQSQKLLKTICTNNPKHWMWLRNWATNLMPV